MEERDFAASTDVNTLERILIAVAATGLGHVAAGPVGSVASAGAVPAMEAVYGRFKERLIANAARVPRRAAEHLERTVEDVAAQIADDDRLLMLTATGMHAASQTLWDDKVEALSRMLADGLKDDARVDLCTLLSKSLANIEKPHLQVLMAMISDANPARPEVQAPQPPTHIILSGRRWTYYELTTHLPHIGAHAMINLLATMEYSGLLTRDHTNYLVYQPTGYAAMTLDYLNRGRLGLPPIA